jgi:hypothetical protein
VRRARLAIHGVPGHCCYLEVLVLVFCFPYILVLSAYTLPLMGRHNNLDTLAG